MNSSLFLTLLRRGAVLSAAMLCLGVCPAAESPIRIHTDLTDLLLKVDEQGRLCQSYFGPALQNEQELAMLPPGNEAFATHGPGNQFAPALQMTHPDGNTSLQLVYEKHQTCRLDEGITQTTVSLRDRAYPVEVKLILTAFERENVIKSRTEILHDERGSVTLHAYASSMLRLQAGSYHLTEFSGDWAREANLTETRLTFGKKLLDSPLGTRANMFCSPMFAVALDTPASETNGTVLLGTLAWSGNFRFTFEVDQNNELRILAGINPFASEYPLSPKKVFRTPEFIFTLSTRGIGEASRSLHDWARRHQLKEGEQGRMTLLNNWEATFFDFDEERLCAIMDDAREIGVEMFLLDDGWFGNKHPRHDDTQGLGDWVENREKLPGGIPALTRAAKKRGIRFGLWIEPEMVNPRSLLYEKHPDWILRYPNREACYFRNQLVLDLTNPEVQEFVFGTVDRLMSENPDIAYFKWDCNSPIMNAHSAYLGSEQSRLWVDYVKGLYAVLERIREKYPDLPMMLCSGGGGRTDYGALSYFTEFWPSDNTDPLERIFIQWGYSCFFPLKSLCAHVTNWNRSTSIKFRTDVAMMGKLGFDLVVKKLSPDEIRFVQQALKDYKRLRPTILDGDLYRLVSPYSGQHAALQTVAKDRSQAVLFAYDLNPRYGEPLQPVRPEGLDPDRRYRIREINLMPGESSRLALNDRVLSGDYLMKVGLEIFSTERARSTVVELTAE